MVSSGPSSTGSNQAWIKTSTDQAATEPEWRRALTHLVQAEARYTNANGRPEQTNLGALIVAAAGIGNDDGFAARDADQHLRGMGVRVKGQSLFILNRSEGVARSFRDTPWATGWLATLGRAPGCSRSVAHRFTRSLQGKAVQIPMAVVTGGDE